MPIQGSDGQPVPPPADAARRSAARAARAPPGRAACPSEPRRRVEVEAVVTDLSFEGCRLQSQSALKAGEAIRLIVHDRGALRATVQWVSGTNSGLLFLPEPAAAGAEEVERRHQRISLEAEVALRRAGKLTFRVRLFDLSPAGCKAEFVEKPELHEPVWIRFDAMDAIEANVCWIAGAKVGLRFLRPVHPAVFEMLLVRLNR